MKKREAVRQARNVLERARKAHHVGASLVVELDRDIDGSSVSVLLDKAALRALVNLASRHEALLRTVRRISKQGTLSEVITLVFEALKRDHARENVR